MNQNFTIFGKIENQISANQPLKHFTLCLINMYIKDQVNDCLSAKFNTSEGILKKFVAFFFGTSAKIIKYMNSQHNTIKHKVSYSSV